MLGGWLNWKGTQTPHTQFYNNMLRSMKKPGLRLKCYLALPGHLNTCSASSTPTKSPWSGDKAQRWAPSYRALWTGQHKAALLICNTETRWWYWKMITAKQRDTFTAGRYRTPLRGSWYCRIENPALFITKRDYFFFTEFNIYISNGPTQFQFYFLHWSHPFIYSVWLIAMLWHWFF